MRKKDSFLLFFLILSSLSFFKFFRPLVISDLLLKLIHYIFLSVVIIVSAKEFLIKKNTGYSKLISTLVILVLISILSAYLFWEQSPILTFVSSFGFFSFFHFFFFKKFNLSIDFIERLVWWLTVVYMVCFTYALLKAPMKVFLGYGEIDKDLNNARGLFRIRLTLIGAGPLYLAFYMAISKYLKTKLSKWLIITIILFVYIALQLGRQSILISLVLGFLFLFTKVSFFKKILITLVCYGVIWFSIISVPFISKMLEETENQVNYNKDEDDIRIKAYKFYMVEMTTNPFTGLFGKGMYTLVDNNPYGDYINTYGRNKGLIPSDVGYAKIYLLFGVSGLLIFFIIFYRTLKQKVPEEYLYVKYYIFSLMIGSVAGSPLLGTIPIYCMAVYILYVLKNKKYNKKLLNEKK